ncbi:hypothetical protein AB1K83_00590 [Sporosarcina sp. 179-K 3D1 HS]|uniref:hypothetical protein n=1 Tax=Sporosarcina sp. 179-K 3D1 HS TaxID=3232169 RepID=UPI00399FC048
MSKIRNAVIALALIALLTACGHPDPNVTFTGTILDIHGPSATVVADEGEEIRRSGSEVTVDLSVNEEETFEVGNRVKVTYDGVIREIHPLSINTIAVEKVK